MVDLLFNLPCNEQYKNTPKGKAGSWIPFVGSLSQKFKPSEKMHQTFVWNTSAMNDVGSNEKQGNKAPLSTNERRQRFAKDAETVAGWEFDRIIPCHGDTIETGGKQAWLQAYSRVGDRCVLAVVWHELTICVGLYSCSTPTGIPRSDLEGGHALYFIPISLLF